MQRGITIELVQVSARCSVHTPVLVQEGALCTAAEGLRSVQ